MGMFSIFKKKESDKPKRKIKAFTTPQMLEEIRRDLTSLRVERGMIGGTIKIEPLNANIKGRPLEAEIGLEQWDAHVRLNVFWNPDRGIVIKYCSDHGIIDPVKQACHFAGDHEIGHWKVCPHSVPMHVDIQDGIADFLKSAGKKSKSLIQHLANCFEDIADNAHLRYEGERSLSVFYSETGHFTKFFAAYMLVQLHVWGDAEDRKLLQPNFSKLSGAELAEARTAAENVLKEWGVQNMSQEDMHKVLMNEKNWVSMAKIFAKNTHHLVKIVKGNSKPKKNKDGGQGQSEQGESQEGEGEGQQGEGEGEGQGQGQADVDESSGAGKGGKEKSDKPGDGKEDKDGGKGSGEKDEKEKGEKEDGEGGGSGKKEQRPDGDIEDSGDEYDSKDISDGSNEDDKVNEKKSGPGSDTMDKELEKDDQRKKVMEDRINRAKGKGRGRGAGSAGVPHFMDAAEAVQYYYEIEAADIPITAEEEDKGMSMPVKKFKPEEFDPDVHEQRDIFGPMLSDEGEPTLGAHRFKYEMNFPFMKGIKGFPNVMWIVDTSGSMFCGSRSNSIIPWPEGSGYHFALLGAVGTMKWLQREGILPYIKLQMVTFSDATVVSGWRDFSQADAIRRAMFNYQSGGTQLDPKVLCPELDKADPSLIILLSDGEIYNWSTAKDELLASMKRHQVVFVRLGSYGNTTASDFAAAGHAVTDPINKDEDMANLMIDVTKKTMNAILEAEKKGE